MPLIDEAYFLARHGQKVEDFAGLIDNHLPDAADELAALVGDSQYEIVESILHKNPEERTESEDTQLDAFQRAEAELIMYCILPKLNVKIGREGLVQMSQSQTFGDGTFRIASPKEIGEIQNTYMLRARKILRKWLQPPGFVCAAVTDSE